MFAGDQWALVGCSGRWSAFNSARILRIPDLGSHHDSRDWTRPKGELNSCSRLSLSLNLNSSCPRPKANPPPLRISTLYIILRMLPMSPYHRHLSVTLPTVQRTRASQEWVQEPSSRSAWPKLSALTLLHHVTITNATKQEPFLCFTNGQSDDTRHAED